MSTLRIRGRVPLSGTLRVAGSKNAALPLIAAAALSARPWRLTNLPDVSDVAAQLNIFRALGGTVVRRAGAATLTMARAPKPVLPVDLARRLRASILFVPALLARSGRASFPHPGGCVIGTRPIDLFLEGFRAFGARVREQRGVYTVALRACHAARYAFTVQSHTGSEALLMLAAASGVSTRIENAALEPEVGQVVDALTAAGARIARTANGTGYTVRGTRTLGGTTVRVIPDRIEAGTFLALAALTGPRIAVTGFDPSHLTVPMAYLTRLGAPPNRTARGWRVRAGRRYAMELRTHEYPGFPTDLQAPFTVLLTQAEGVSLVHETVYEGRLHWLDKLRAMGARVLLADPHRAIVEGPTALTGASIESPDIRAGIALVLAALVAKGVTRIEHAELIDRGYERIVERLQGLGAQIHREG